MANYKLKIIHVDENLCLHLKSYLYSDALKQPRSMENESENKLASYYTQTPKTDCLGFKEYFAGESTLGLGGAFTSGFNILLMWVVPNSKVP